MHSVVEERMRAQLSAMGRTGLGPVCGSMKKPQIDASSVAQPLSSSLQTTELGSRDQKSTHRQQNHILEGVSGTSIFVLGRFLFGEGGNSTTESNVAPSFNWA